MITLGNYAPLSAAWTVQKAAPPRQRHLCLADAGSVGAITSWVVNFGDGSPNYTYNVSPGSAGGAAGAGAQTTHIYASSGSYTATLSGPMPRMVPVRKRPQ